MKAKEKKLAIRLRKEGKVFREILKQVDVSKGTLSLWLRDIPLSKKHLSRIENLKEIGREKASTTLKKIWKERYKKIYDEYFPPFNDPFFMIGLGLYMGEGDKYARNAVGLSNSDKKILLIYKEWIERFFAEDTFKWRGCASVHDTKDKERVKVWWSEKLRIPLNLFSKTVISISRASKKKRNTLKNGTFHLLGGGEGTWKIATKIKKAMDNAPVV